MTSTDQFDVVSLEAVTSRPNETQLEVKDLKGVFESYQNSIRETHTKYTPPRGTPTKPFSALDNYPILRLLGALPKDEPPKVVPKRVHVQPISVAIAIAEPPTEIVDYTGIEEVGFLDIPKGQAYVQSSDGSLVRVKSSQYSDETLGMTREAALNYQHQKAQHYRHHVPSKRFRLTCAFCSAMKRLGRLNGWRPMTDFKRSSFNICGIGVKEYKPGYKWFISLGSVAHAERTYARWMAAALLRDRDSEVYFPHDSYIPPRERRLELAAKFEKRIEHWRRTGSAV